MVTSEEVRFRPARAVRLAVAILLHFVLLVGVAGVQSGQAAGPHPLPSVLDSVADGPDLPSLPGGGSEGESAHPPHPGHLPPGSGSDAPWGAVFSDTTFLFPERLPLASGGDEDEGEVAHDALTGEQRARIQAIIDENIRRLDAEGKLPAANAPAVLFQWPLKAAPEVSDYDNHVIWDYVDHNPAYPGQVLDYNCGNRTYDWSSGYNHGGTDFGLWPFPWNKMEGDEVQVVSVAPGTIIGKDDGNFDKNCSVVAGADWNAIYVRHTDGSIAWYGHLKNGSLTLKPVGSSVTAGEYLGIVGSSGQSSLPHLHFEVHDASNNRIDPYFGTCNPLDGGSWWASQRPYYDSGINLLMTANATVENQPCPNPAIIHQADHFSPGDTVYFAAFYRDLVNGQVSHYTIYRPDDSIFQSWDFTYTNAAFSATGNRWWSYHLSSDAMEGTWRFKVIYAGQTYQTTFTVGDLLPSYLPLILRDS
jgi:hypothetical protein